MAYLDDINEEIDKLVDLSSKDTFNRDSPLHLTRSVKIAKELLVRGANVNLTNRWRETPLHVAVFRGKKLELVRVLLKHGATAINKTALNMVPGSTSCNQKVFEELLKYGVDMNITMHKRAMSYFCYTPLDFAVENLLCAKLLIRHTALKYFNRYCYKKLIDLCPYQKSKYYNELTSYLDDCVCEIVQMKTDKLKDDITVFALVTKQLHNIKWNNSLSVKLSKIDFNVRYPIYNDIISDKILERPNLLNKLSEIQFYTKLDILNEDVKEKKIILDPDSTLCITEYLSNAELLNFITAYDDPKQCSSQSLNNLVKRDRNFCGTDINQEIDKLVDLSSKDTINRDSPLHLTRSVEVSKELLVRGANVNLTNRWRETPLHVAVFRGKKLELVRVLLKHGATAINKTALNMVPGSTSCNQKVFEELLKYGVDMDITKYGRAMSYFCYTPLDFAVENLLCAKLLIRHTVLKYFNSDYKKLIDLYPYQNSKYYNELTSYLVDCAREIVQMKTDKLKDDITVFALVTNQLHNIKWNNSLSVKLSKIDFNIHYPIYNDIISDKILERPNLLNKLSEIQFYTKLDILNEDVKEKKIILDPDSTLCITEYLSNAELLNFITAYDDPKQCSSQNFCITDINQEIDKLVDLSSKDTINRDSPLHLTRSVEVAKELLVRGANVNLTNRWRETPLHVAVFRGKKLELVRVLLKHGATAINKTALNMVPRSISCNQKVYEELLKYGVDMNITMHKRAMSYFCYTPLDFAVENLLCAKLLIRHTVLKYFNSYYKELIDLCPYQKSKYYNELTSYLDDCVCEVLQMKTDVIKDGLTLYNFVNKALHIRQCNNSLSVKLSKIDFNVRYPIYNDIISDKILERSNLLNKLSEIQFYTKLDIFNQDVKEIKIILDPDSTLCIAEYLSNAELINLIIAYDDSEQCSSQSLNNLVKRDQNFCDTETDNEAKRPRLI